MKAIVCPAYGGPDVLRLEDVETPVPGEGEVRVKVHASSINAGDWHLMRADPWLVRLEFGLKKPKSPILGADVAGVVDAVGEKVTRFQPGDAVFGDVSGCGFGGFAEYVCGPESVFVAKPESVSFETAAATPAAGITALQGLRDKGGIQGGESVLINGASGGVGTFAVQLAKGFGAEVTAVCSTRNVDRVRELGADHVIDYTQEDFTESGRQYDLILGANGNQSIWAYKRALRPGGRYVMTGGELAQFFQALLLGPLISRFSNVTMGNLLMSVKGEDVAFLAQWLAAGTIRPSIDRRYDLAAVPEAIRYMEQEHAQGKIVIGVCA